MAKTKRPTVGPKGGTGTPPKPQPNVEPELVELGTIIGCMGRLDGDQRWRTLLYLCDRYIPQELAAEFRNALRAWSN